MLRIELLALEPSLPLDTEPVADNGLWTQGEGAG